MVGRFLRGFLRRDRAWERLLFGALWLLIYFASGSSFPSDPMFPILFGLLAFTGLAALLADP